ncbi:MAG: phosphoglucosamine mutase, partial [Clostridia bacterium]|nr:phosphoglucosamine mutase [Clostridia bacterium]
MGRLFGTDGVRGIANEMLTCERALAIGRAAASVLFPKKGGDTRKILIGSDT